MQNQQSAHPQFKGAKKRTLAESCEQLTREWDILKNAPLTPFDVLISDSRAIHWKCRGCGHEFKNSVKNRYYRKSKCPNCFGRSQKGITEYGKFEQSLGYLYPYLMKEWHPTLNGRLNAFEITPASTSRVWWQCSDLNCGHHWRASVVQRVYRGSGCPACTKRADSLKTRHSELSDERNESVNSMVVDSARVGV